jgi:hypothetical protein
LTLVDLADTSAAAVWAVTAASPPYPFHSADIIVTASTFVDAHDTRM